MQFFRFLLTTSQRLFGSILKQAVDEAPYSHAEFVDRKLGTVNAGEVLRSESSRSLIHPIKLQRSKLSRRSQTVLARSELHGIFDAPRQLHKRPVVTGLHQLLVAMPVEKTDVSRDRRHEQNVVAPDMALIVLPVGHE